MSDLGFDFDAALAETLAAVDIGPHCSCAEITAEILRRAIPLESPGLRFAAAGFGGGIGGSGSVCGAFAAGLIALGAAVGERDRPQGCVSEVIMADIQAYYDDWMERHGSICCADLTGFPSLRDETIRDQFYASGGPDECTDECMRFAVRLALEAVTRRSMEGAHREDHR